MTGPRRYGYGRPRASDPDHALTPRAVRHATRTHAAGVMFVMTLGPPVGAHFSPDP